jgi:hypothetical protein
MKTMLRGLLLGLSLAMGIVWVQSARADWALAVGQTGSKAWAFGSSVSADDRGEARKNALSHCRDKGDNCRVVLDGVGGCFALAVGTADNAWAAQQKRTRMLAASAALAECLRSSPGDCEIKKTYCED